MVKRGVLIRLIARRAARLALTGVFVSAAPDAALGETSSAVQIVEARLVTMPAAPGDTLPPTLTQSSRVPAAPVAGPALGVDGDGSNRVEIDRAAPDGGVLNGAPFEYAQSDGAASDGAAEPTVTVQEAAVEPTPAAELPPAALPGWNARGPLMRFEELTLDIGYDASYLRRSVRTDGAGRGPRGFEQRNTAQRMFETVGLRGLGDIGGERFLRYQFDLRGGFIQERYDETRPGPDLSNDPNGSLLQYDARATLFPAGKLSANFAATKLNDRLPRPFLPSLDRNRERYLTELLFNDRVLPMRLAFESNYEELLSFTPQLEDDEQRGNRRVEYEATWQPSDDQELRLDYEYDDRSEEYSGGDTRFDTVRNYVTLNHMLRFGSDRRSRLDTVARFQDESGDLARDIYEIAPQLRLQHTDTLATVARGQYFSESFDGLMRELYRGDLGLNYAPSERLDTTLNTYAITQRAEADGDIDEWGAIASAAYNRENRLGRFSANATYNHAWQRSDEDGEFGVVVSEAVTFRDPLPVFLAQTDVQRISILVTDAARRRTYLVGRDYTVVQIGRFTALTRVRNGRITDGESALVSYRYRVSEGYELVRDRLDFRVQQEFKNGITAYYAGSLQEEDIDRTRFLNYLPRDVNRHRAGLTYRKSRWSVGGELEYNDDAIDPYRAAHLRGDATLIDKQPHTLSARGSASQFRFTGAEGQWGRGRGLLDGPLGRDNLLERDTTMLDLGLAYRAALSSTLEANASAAYRFEDDTLFGRTHGVDLSAALTWRIGKFFASFEVEYDYLDLPGSRDGTLAVWIKLRREIPLLGAAR